MPPDFASAFYSYFAQGDHRFPAGRSRIGALPNGSFRVSFGRTAELYPMTWPRVRFRPESRICERPESAPKQPLRLVSRQAATGSLRASRVARLTSVAKFLLTSRHNAPDAQVVIAVAMGAFQLPTQQLPASMSLVFRCRARELSRQEGRARRGVWRDSRSYPWRDSARGRRSWRRL